MNKFLITTVLIATLCVGGCCGDPPDHCVVNFKYEKYVIGVIKYHGDSFSPIHYVQLTKAEWDGINIGDDWYPKSPKGEGESAP